VTTIFDLRKYLTLFHKLPPEKTLIFPYGLIQSLPLAARAIYFTNMYFKPERKKHRNTDWSKQCAM